MKYINEYNNINDIRYDVGDYVLLKENYFKGIYKTIYIFSKIIEIKKIDSVPYLVEFADGETFWVSNSIITRKMTNDEIKKYELEKSTNKYNI